ncbi:isoprenylcysteine carboxylmethyltransferase family protein [Rubrobacter marinus]|uniref:Isoprenylcysteine carboxylmethyltransferase family protein n=1 Tax=Rubrobacter marinus TaxID=2653852 RepID=A0A6G8Q012_9ACTN|nr:isoprenylcysteine carboxylmethyltransferase family protein [Rubrobacter marinus]QIN79785.1 isoprenylcysteine carboxylmethyltransferase family protein [Rubrobacter marinus]
MALAALTLYALYAARALGGRALLQLRRTGSTGIAGIKGRPGSVEWSGGVLFVAASLLFLAAPVLDLAGLLRPVAALDGPAGHALGFMLYFAGLAGPLVSQLVMGASWRVGVDQAEKTKLVTAGPFALVRNPIFSSTVAAFVGITLVLPNAAALVGLAAMFVSVETQVRMVEEPYPIRAHGAGYAAYASRAGRFVPGLGRLERGGTR